MSSVYDGEQVTIMSDFMGTWGSGLYDNDTTSDVSGEGAIVRAGSVVTKDVPDYAVVGENPVVILKYTT